MLFTTCLYNISCLSFVGQTAIKTNAYAQNRNTMGNGNKNNMHAVEGRLDQLIYHGFVTSDIFFFNNVVFLLCRASYSVTRLLFYWYRF